MYFCFSWRTVRLSSTGSWRVVSAEETTLNRRKPCGISMARGTREVRISSLALRPRLSCDRGKQSSTSRRPWLSNSICVIGGSNNRS